LHQRAWLGETPTFLVSETRPSRNSTTQPIQSTPPRFMSRITFF
jgi:hypothetical protein